MLLPNQIRKIRAQGELRSKRVVHHPTQDVRLAAPCTFSTHNAMDTMKTDSEDRIPTDEVIATRKSLVRVGVTYAAAFFLFIVGPLLILGLILSADQENALEVFNTLLPVAAAIIAFWFAGRGKGHQKQNDD